MKLSHILIISIVTLISSLIIALGLSGIKASDRTVTVRGLSEREVPADLCVWPLAFELGDNALESLQANIVAKTDKVKEFLGKYDLTSEDYSLQAPRITDNSLDRYIDKSKITYRYTARVTLYLRSKKIESVRQARTNSFNLLQEGIVISSDYDTQMTYEFTGLNEIKPAMIEEATQNARKAAEQFATDSGSKVGKIKRATQGLFSIEDAALGLPERKNVRVVTNIEYLLK